MDDAVEKGARILATAGSMPAGDQYAAPMVLGGATTDLQLASEERFGPVASLFRFDTEEEAIRIANATPFGLAAYFHTESLKRSWRVGEALEFGMIGLKTGAISPRSPRSAASSNPASVARAGKLQLPGATETAVDPLLGDDCLDRIDGSVERPIERNGPLSAECDLADRKLWASPLLAAIAS